MKYVIAIATILTLAACTQAPLPAPDTREADAKAIRDAEAALLANFKAKDVDKMGTFWADDATFMMTNMPAMKGNAAIKAMWKDVIADPNFTVEFGANKVEVSKASDYAYSQGTYSSTMTDPKTKKVVVEKGSYVTVFQKQAGGSWKAVQDIAVAEAPAAPAPAAK
jgi:ketosteroid isomerase-like protein